jgi:hypothetical protein
LVTPKAWKESSQGLSERSERNPWKAVDQKIGALERAPGFANRILRQAMILPNLAPLPWRLQA